MTPCSRTWFYVTHTKKANFMQALLIGAALGAASGIVAARGAEQRSTAYVLAQRNVRSTDTMRVAAAQLQQCADAIDDASDRQTQDVQLYARKMAAQGADLAKLYDSASSYTTQVDDRAALLAGELLTNADRLTAVYGSASKELQSAAEEVRVDALGIIQMLRQAQPPQSYGG